jgi:hypothetical protein
MPSYTHSAKTTANKNVHTNPFQQIHGHPTWSDYEILKNEASTLTSKVEDITCDWSRDTATGKEFGLLAKILGLDEYDHQTGIDTYVEEVKPDT